MAYDFPASPAVGAVFTPSGGPTWQWDGTVWKNTATAVLSAIVSDTAPPGPYPPGQLWWNSTTGKMMIWYTDANSSQWVEAHASADDEVIGGKITIASTAPSSPAVNDVWIDTT